MIKRYAVSEITKIWNDHHKFQVAWQVEKNVCCALHQLGVIPDSDWDVLNNHCMDINLDRIETLEAITHHETVALIKYFTEQINHPSSKWIHYGLTSNDVIDTTQNYLIKESNVMVGLAINDLMTTLKKTALKYKYQSIMGRTHGMAAEPTSLGLKFLLWFCELKRWCEQFTKVRANIECVKISGSLGNYAHVDPQVQKIVAKKMHLSVDWSATQVTQRDRHIGLFNSFASLASTMEKIAIEFRHWQRSEVGEVMEGYSKDQKGSSSMPHKKNPISAENISGLSRLIRSYTNIAYQNNLLWHERDISHSSNERVILPDCYHSVVYTIRRLQALINNMVVNEEQITTNLGIANNIYYSQTIMTYLISHSKLDRNTAYDILQKAAFQSSQKKEDFLSIIKRTQIMDYIDEKTLDKICQITYFLRNVDIIYKQLEIQ